MIIWILTYKKKCEGMSIKSFSDSQWLSRCGTNKTWALFSYSDSRFESRSYLDRLSHIIREK